MMPDQTVPLTPEELDELKRDLRERPFPMAETHRAPYNEHEIHLGAVDDCPKCVKP